MNHLQRHAYTRIRRAPADGHLITVAIACVVVAILLFASLLV